MRIRPFVVRKEDNVRELRKVDRMPSLRLSPLLNPSFLWLRPRIAKVGKLAKTGTNNCAVQTRLMLLMKGEIACKSRDNSQKAYLQQSKLVSLPSEQPLTKRRRRVVRSKSQPWRIGWQDAQYRSRGEEFRSRDVTWCQAGTVNNYHLF